MSWCALEASAAPVNNTSDARWRALRLARGLLLPVDDGGGCERLAYAAAAAAAAAAAWGLERACGHQLAECCHGRLLASELSLHSLASLACAVAVAAPAAPGWVALIHTEAGWLPGAWARVLSLPCHCAPRSSVRLAALQRICLCLGSHSAPLLQEVRQHSMLAPEKAHHQQEDQGNTASLILMEGRLLHVVVCKPVPKTPKKAEKCTAGRRISKGIKSYNRLPE
eukprot:1140325-Pelagomonas_calceolata.AAC.6